MKFHKLHRFKVALIMFVVLMTASLAAEFAAQGWLALHSRKPMSDFDYFMTRPAAYQQSSYWSPEFVKAMFGITWKLTKDRYWRPDDYHTPWFNYENGMRVTDYQPEHAEHTIYMFGNSTLLGSGVPDEYTIASFLQLDLNRTYGTKYRVLNLAIPGATIGQQVNRLKTVQLAAGDIVIFYDGAQDAANIYPKAVEQTRLDKPEPCRSLLKHYGQLGLVKLACGWGGNEFPTSLSDSEWMQSTLNQTAQYYREAILDALQYTTQYDARFYHFLQPHLWTRPLSLLEQETANNHDLIPRGMAETYLAVWPVLKSSPATIDLTHILDAARASGNEMFIDQCHITERGNKIVAHAMFLTILVANIQRPFR